MIFRYLHRRRVVRGFGRFVRPDMLETLCQISEWQALKSFLPKRWLYTAEQEEASLREVVRLARDCLEVGSVEALLGKIDEASEQTTDFDLWVPMRLTLRGAKLPSEVAMAVVLDRLLGKGFMPDGFTQEVHGRTYHYKRGQISN